MGHIQIWGNKIRGNKKRANEEKNSQFRVYTGSEGTLFPQRKNRAPHINHSQLFLTHSFSAIYKKMPPPLREYLSSPLAAYGL
jgi:hypothetical protein